MIPASKSKTTRHVRRMELAFPTSKKSNGRESRVLKDLTIDVWEKILEYVSKGAYDYVVAEALGITQATWTKWMAKGRSAKSGLYREFYLGVTQARSRARALAEISVAEMDPKFWLLKGPGRDRQGRPGWSNKQTIEFGHEETPNDATMGQDGRAVLGHDGLKEAFRIMQELGFLTPEGMKMFQPSTPELPPPLEVFSQESEDET